MSLIEGGKTNPFHPLTLRAPQGSNKTRFTKSVGMVNRIGPNVSESNRGVAKGKTRCIVRSMSKYVKMT